MEFLKTVLSEFEPISLQEMDNVSLLNRVDTKFTFKLKQLPEFLATLQPHYRILENQGNRISKYETLYYDTPDFLLFQHHHCGRLNRVKIRYRSYTESCLSYFEIKFRNNRSRTIKKRIKREAIEQVISPESAKFLEQKTNFKASDLVAQLWVYYSRITLVNKSATERLTIDVGLTFSNHTHKTAFPSLVIAEVKMEKSGKSPFITLMRQNHIASGSISKYCMGIATLIDHVKKNNFKEKLRNIKKLCNE